AHPNHSQFFPPAEAVLAGGIRSGIIVSVHGLPRRDGRRQAIILPEGVAIHKNKRSMSRFAAAFRHDRLAVVVYLLGR
ncbi:MAG TPA: hypothetical protein VKA66_08375, partial [Mycobacterium sp.]|nr:hypothetical protein [Mycobacterium sp.]